MRPAAQVLHSHENKRTIGLARCVVLGGAASGGRAGGWHEVHPETQFNTTTIMAGRDPLAVLMFARDNKVVEMAGALASGVPPDVANAVSRSH